MIESAHVNKRKQVFTDQYPVGDDVSLSLPLRSSDANRTSNSVHTWITPAGADGHGAEYEFHRKQEAVFQLRW